MMSVHDWQFGSGAQDAVNMIMGPPEPVTDPTEQLAAVIDRLALDTHHQISAADQHWQIAIHLWPALKAIARHTGPPQGHLLAVGVDADMLAGAGPHPHYPRDPRRHLAFHTPIPPTSQWPHHDLPQYELGTQTDPGQYDLVLLNLPYHDAALLNPGRRTRLGTYHRDLITSALDQTAPGGIIVALASPVLLDHPDQTLRQAVADRADLVGAVRLPSATMRPDSHAEDPTDVLILRRRRPGEPGPGIPPARDVTTWSGPGYLNKYWLDNPEHVLGQLFADPDTATFIVAPRAEPLGRSMQVAFDQIVSPMISAAHAGALAHHEPLPDSHNKSEPPSPADMPGL